MSLVLESPQRPLKVAFFLEGMYASGVDTSTQLLADALRTQGHRVVTFLPWKERCDDGSSDRVLLSALRVNSKQAVYLSYPISLRLLSLFKEMHFDLIHVHTSTSVNLLAWQVSSLFGIPIVYTYHTMTKEYMHYFGNIPETMESLVTAVVEKFDKVVCNKADAIITPSAKAAAYLAEIGVTPPVSIIPNGIKLDDFSPWPSDYLRARFAIPAQAKILLWVGRLNQEKRPLLAYEIFRDICRQHDNVGDNVVLVMVGDGALRSELEARARRDRLQNRLLLTGLVDYKTMPAIYNSADLWISTSQSEVHPMVAIEAAACGLPAIAWSDRALQGVVEDGVSGFIVDNKSAFVNRLSRILNDGALYQQMRRAALAKGQTYSIETTAYHIAQLYKEVVNPRALAPTLPPTNYQRRFLNFS